MTHPISQNFSPMLPVLKDVGSNGRNHSDEASGDSNSHNPIP